MFSIFAVLAKYTENENSIHNFKRAGRGRGHTYVRSYARYVRDVRMRGQMFDSRLYFYNHSRGRANYLIAASVVYMLISVKIFKIYIILCHCSI